MTDPIRAALSADGPAVPEGREPASVATQPSDRELLELMPETMRDEFAYAATTCSDATGGQVKPRIFRVCLNTAALEYARAVLARYGHQPAPAAEGEVRGLVAELRSTASGLESQSYPQTAALITRAADLLEQRHPAPVPVADALIKAECALSDIAEGEPMTDEGDPLQWAERRCADTLAIIRPWMKQYGIRTSEWPPLPAHALPLPATTRDIESND